MADCGEPVEFEFVVPTPEQLEAEAKLLTPIEVTAVPEDAVQQTTSFGVSLRVPPDLESAASDNPDQASWHGGDAYSLTVSLHEGTGHFVCAFEFDDDAPSPHEEGVFQIPLAGRAAEIVLMRSTLAEHESYFASASAAVAPNWTITVFLVAPTEELRARLIATIPTVFYEG